MRVHHVNEIFAINLREYFKVMQPIFLERQIDNVTKIGDHQSFAIQDHCNLSLAIHQSFAIF